MASVTELDERTIRDFVDLMVCGKPLARGYVRTYAAGRVDYSTSARECYSYGRHFPLARYVPGKSPLWVINGDEWRQQGPSRTSSHQFSIRAAIAKSGVESIIIPFSALNGAGIDIDSIRPLHVRADATWTETVERRTLDEVPRHRRFYSVPTSHESTNPDDRPMGYGYIRPDENGVYRWTEYHNEPIAPDSDGIYRWDETRHRMGDSLFTAVRAQTFTRDAAPFEGERDGRTISVVLHDTNGGYRRRDCQAQAGKFDRHEAGPDAACIHCSRPLRATVTWRRRARYLSSFDTNETPPLYFLCEVSRDCHPTVEGALDSLAPRAVHAAYLNGTEVRRQGDVFFIDTPLTDADLESRGAVFGRLTQWTRDAAPRPGEVTYVHRSPAEKRRRARLERNYARKLWRERWSTDVANAMLRDSARPSGKRNDRSHAWRMPARDVYRRCYGSNAYALWYRCLTDARARYRPETVGTATAMQERRERVRRHLAVYGTAHSATRVARVGTAVYVQGTVRHAVELESGRRDGPDHRPITLTAGRWYLAVRNTVPRQSRRPRMPRRRTDSGISS